MKQTKAKFPRGVEVVGGAIIEDNQGRILLARSSKWHEKWMFPGGHIEPGETIIEGTLREVWEETGLKVKPEGILNWGENINTPNFHRPAHLIYFHVHFKALSDEVTLDNFELQEYKWVTPQEALKMDLGVSYFETIKKLMEYFENKN